jgi:tRNA (guanine37-N1)-methyltransferase
VRIDIVSIFPEYLDPLRLSLVGKAVDAGLVDLGVHDLRSFAHDRHRTVDDTPYGGGPGMVMSPVPWGEALDQIAGADPVERTGGGKTAGGGVRPLLVVPTPSGERFTQSAAQRWSDEPWLVLACGRYEGIDARVIEHYAGRCDWAGVQEVSIGDYVLAGGEAAALVIVEAVVRLIPGVLGNAASVADDSFAAGSMERLLEGPVYTKPPEWRGLGVPGILMSGHHGRIAAWRAEQAHARTLEHRPDLLG